MQSNVQQGRPWAACYQLGIPRGRTSRVRGDADIVPALECLCWTCNFWGDTLGAAASARASVQARLKGEWPHTMLHVVDTLHCFYHSLDSQGT